MYVPKCISTEDMNRLYTVEGQRRYVFLNDIGHRHSKMNKYGDDPNSMLTMYSFEYLLVSFLKSFDSVSVELPDKVHLHRLIKNLKICFSIPMKNWTFQPLTNPHFELFLASPLYSYLLAPCALSYLHRYLGASHFPCTYF